MRELTGEWYLEKQQSLRKGTYRVRVQVKVSTWHDPSYGNGGGDYQTRTEWQYARPDDIIELGIKTA